MEDYIKHVFSFVDDNKMRRAWCGEVLDPFEWAFEDADHAAWNGVEKGRLLTCPACALAIYKAMCQE